MFLSFRWLSLSVTDSPALASLVAAYIFHMLLIPFQNSHTPGLSLLLLPKKIIVVTSEVVSNFLTSTIISSNGFKASLHLSLLYCNAVSVMIEG